MVRAVHEQLLDLGQSFGAVGLILGVVALVWKWPVGPLVRWGRSAARFFDQFRDDWIGVDDRDGVPGRPGVMTQLAEQRSSMSAVRERVTRLERDWERFVRFERDLLKVRSDVTFLMAPHQTPQRSDDDRT